MPRDDDKDPVWGKKSPHKPFTVVGDKSDLVFRPARLPDPSTIPPRPWLYGTQMLRGYVSVLIAPGGVGKTGYAMAVALCIASGRDLFGERIFRPCNVAVLNLEDPMDELERRLAALMIHHGVENEEIEGKYFLYSGDERKVTVAKLSEDGFEVVHPDEEAIIREIQAHNIGALVIDPYAESHDLEENSNPAMVKAVGAWRRIARITKVAIFLIHHVRKGAADGIDSARGAKALTDAARVGLLLSAMTDAEASGFDIEEKDRSRYVRLDDAKVNMAPKAGVARWFELVTVPLGNGTREYPGGDRVAAVSHWVPPSLMGDMTIQQCNDALDAIAKGPRDGVLYTHNRSGRSKRWAGQVLIDMFGIKAGRAAAIIAEWMKNSVLESREYDDKEQRKKDVLGLFVVDSRRPGTSL